MDGDPAANIGGWQWAAGTGTDAQPYFRIFNPVAQSQKFDPNGNYIRYWVPELRDVPLNAYMRRGKWTPPTRISAADGRSCDGTRPRLSGVQSGQNSKNG
ncbi:MAG: FAD-binding domain-containing protein [Anaerolineae bacterium]